MSDLAASNVCTSEGRMMLNLARSLDRLSIAVKSLARVKDGKTLFEHSPSKDAEAYAAWTELDAAQKDAAVKLRGYKLLTGVEVREP